MLKLYILLEIRFIIAMPEFAYGEETSMTSSYLSTLSPQSDLFTKNTIVTFPNQFSENPQILLSIINVQANQGFRISAQSINTNSFILQYQFYIGGFNGAIIKYFAVVDDNIQIDNTEITYLDDPSLFEQTAPLTKNFPQIPNAIIFLNGYEYSLVNDLSIELSICKVSQTEYSYRMQSTNALTYFSIVVIIGISPYLEVGTQSGTLGSYTLGEATQYDYFILQGMNGININGMNLVYTIQKQFEDVTCIMNVQLTTTLTQEPLLFTFSYFFYRPCGLDFLCSNQLVPRNFQQCSLRKNGCPMSYYADLTINKCLECSINCNTCATSSTNCTTCSNQLNRSPLCMCGDHQYLDTNSQCQECPASCQQCDGSQCTQCAINCLSCNYSTCLTCAASNYYIQNGLCVECPNDCATCNQNQCLDCNYPLSLIDGECIQICTFPCLTCCLNQCLTCTDGYYPASASCVKCDQNCVNCLNASFCLSCDSTKYRTLNQYNQCTCVEGYIEKDNICVLDKIVYNNNQSSYIECTYGYLNINNECKQCDMKCLNCLTQINICTTCRFNTPSNGQQECELCESFPGYYSDYQTNKCNTICGDGIIAGNEQCDDLFQPIGCSNCQTLSNYACDQYQCELIIYPVPTFVELSDSTQIYNNTKMFLLTYNIELASFDPNITVRLSDSSITYIYQLLAIDQSYYMQLTLMNTSININLTITFEIQNITSLVGQTQLLNFITIEISDYILLTEITKAAVSGVSQGINVILILVLVLIGISILFGGLEIYWNLLDLLQRISYLKYINTILPYNMTQIIQSFSYVQLSNLPYMEYLNFSFIPYDEIQCQLPQGIANDGYTCSMSQNILPILLPWVISFSVYLVANILQAPIIYININTQLEIDNKFLQFQRYVYKQLSLITNQWIWSGMIRLYQSSAYDISFMLALSLYGISSLQYLDRCLTYGLFCLHLYIIYLCFKITSFNLLTLKYFQNKYGAIIEGLELKQENLLFNNITFVKRLLFIMVLVLLYNYPLFQISIIVFIQLFQVLMLICFRPLNNHIEQNKQIVCETFITLAELLINLLVVDDYYTLFTYDQRDLIGWIWVFCISIIIIAQLLVDLIQQMLIFRKQERPIDINNLRI